MHVALRNRSKRAVGSTRPRGPLCAALCALAFAWPAHAADLISFWDVPQRGANSFNRLPPSNEYFHALRGYGATWVRLAYDKWPAQKRDFLLGDADRYVSLNGADFAVLKTALDRAHAAGLKVVLAPLTLPGARWRQNNDGRFDDRLWSDAAYRLQAQDYWRDLAAALRAHPAIAAYNVLNEPAPEAKGGLAEHADAGEMRAWYARVKGGPRDLPLFYAEIIEAIRDVDPVTPVMVDAGWYAAADAFAYWPAPLADSRTLYAFHMYEPYAAMSAQNLKRDTPLTYPGVLAFGESESYWDGERVARYLDQPFEWAKRHGVPETRMVAAEFGCMRRLPHCARYLEDVLAALDRYRAHWAFYSFREDSWDGMDYELGTAKVPYAYWQAIEAGTPDPVPRKPTEVFEPILKRLRGEGAPNAARQ